mgnify:CR=1 FL=1
MARNFLQILIDKFPVFTIENRLLFAAYVGSSAHNTYVPSSDPNSIDDIDLFAVVVPPKRFIYGLQNFEHWTLREGDLDFTVFSLQKYVRLLAFKSNPNMLCTLWLRDEDYLYKDKSFDGFLSLRGAFNQRDLIYKAFGGYAHDQLKRMTHQAYEGYMGEKRKTLVDKFGYDCKNAAHCIRLLLMGIGFFNTCRLQVWQPDDKARMLRSIKKGEWPTANILQRAEQLKLELDLAYKNTEMSKTPPIKLIENLLIDTIDHYNDSR